MLAQARRGGGKSAGSGRVQRTPFLDAPSHAATREQVPGIFRGHLVTPNTERERGTSESAWHLHRPVRLPASRRRGRSARGDLRHRRARGRDRSRSRWRIAPSNRGGRKPGVEEPARHPLVLAPRARPRGNSAAGDPVLDDSSRTELHLTAGHVEAAVVDINTRRRSEVDLSRRSCRSWDGFRYRVRPTPQRTDDRPQ